MTAALPRTLPLVECTGFCEHGHGQPGEQHPDDQVCTSVSGRVRTGWAGRAVEAYVCGTIDSDPTLTVEVSAPSGTVVLDWTVEQAQQVIAMLAVQVEVATAARAAVAARVGTGPRLPGTLRAPTPRSTR